MAFATLTPEQRAINLAKSKEAMRLAAERRAATKHLLKLDYMDMGHWQDLARKHGLARMPSKEEAVTTSTLRTYLGRLNVPTEIWNDSYTGVGFFVEKNPTWTKYAAVGLILELKEEYKL